MCSAFFSFQTQAELLFLLAFNRDEFFSRPTAPAQFWLEDDDLLGGRDLEREGTWLGVNRQARFAFLTNFREADPNQQKDAPSRGTLVLNFLRGTISPLQYLFQLPAADFNGFNLVVGDLSTKEIAYLTNRDQDGPLKLVPGTYGLSNGTLNSAWPKVLHGKAALQTLENEGAFANGQVPWDAIFDRVLGSTTQIDDDAQLPRTGLPLDWERHLSPIFLNPLDTLHSGTLYGTRSQTVLAVYADGRAELRELTCQADGNKTGVAHQFSVDLSRRSSRDHVRLNEWDASRGPSLDRGDAVAMREVLRQTTQDGGPQLPFAEGCLQRALDADLAGREQQLKLYTTF